MKKLVKRTVLFLLLAVPFYLLALLAVGSLPYPFHPNLFYPLGGYGYMHTRIREIPDFKDVDILFCGPSFAYRGFDPRIFAAAGYTSFNLASSSQQPIQTKLLLDRYLDGLNPQQVVMAVGPGSMVDDGVESTLDLIANDRKDAGLIRMVFKVNHLKTYNALLYGLERSLLGMDKGYRESVDNRGDGTYIRGGFVENKQLNNQADTIIPSRPITFRPIQAEALQAIASLLKQRGIPLTLIYLPVTQAYYHSFTNLPAFHEQMKTYGIYYNLNECLPLNDAFHFYDAQHLNQYGVEIVDQWIIDNILDKK